MGAIKEFFQDYGWMLLVLIVVASAIVFVVTGNLESDGGLSSTIEPFESVDANFTEEHLALANNQQVIFNRLSALDGNHQLILSEIWELNLFSQCTIDTNSLRTVEVPIDNAGAFRRVSLITLVCPELK